MNTIGCTSCHVQNLTINRDRRVADVETVYDPARGIFNDLFATATTLFHIVPDGNQFPLILPNEGSFVVRNFFGDLKRHDLGAFHHERDYDGDIHRAVGPEGQDTGGFVTEALWGVGTTAPYAHDGRSINLNEVILRHGGEALTARNNYAARTADEKMKIQEFLQTLVLFPPDDTASNLNPGNPNTTNPQPPSEHGSIDLSTLFQIPAEGAE
jgi:cytochrome c peroxidase